MSDDPSDALEPLDPDDSAESGFHRDGPGGQQAFIGSVADLAQRAVDAFLLLVRRGTALGVGVLVIVSVICVASYAVGIAALSGGMETVWIVFGGFFAFIAIASVMYALFRLWIVKRISTSLVGEMRALLAGDPRAERVVIETVESSDRVQQQSAVVMSRQFFAMNDALGDRRAQFAGLAIAMRSFMTFPLLLVMASAITFVFAVLGFFFTLGLLL